MNKDFLEFGVPLWWLIPTLVLSAGIAYILYSRKDIPWNRNENILLGTLRFLSLALILLLFLNPILRRVFNQPEKPVVIVGVDNSSSVSTAYSSAELGTIRESIDQFVEGLDEGRYEVKTKFLNSQDSLSFEGKVTDFNRFFNEIQQEYSGRKVAAVTLITDGIFNRGLSPEYRSYAFPVHSVGLGDTLLKQDVVLRNVRNNPVAYAGNQFPIEVEIESKGFKGSTVQLELLSKDGVLDTRRMVLGDAISRHTFLVSEEDPGIRRYTLRVSRLEGEVSYANNSRAVFVEVLDSRKKIRIAARSPHPDIKAIKSVLESTDNYEVILDIAGLTEPSDEKDFDVQVLFDGLDPLDISSGIWAFNNSAAGREANKWPFITVRARGSADQAVPKLNDSFSKFKLAANASVLSSYPPIKTPYGTYNLSGPYEILLYQQIGSVATRNPLLVTYDDGGQKIALTMGRGIWKWRLQEAARFGEAAFFEEMVLKLIQFLSIKDERERFNVEPTKEIFMEDEQVTFETAIYNDIYESVEGQPYSISVRRSGDEGTENFDFVYGTGNVRARTKIFPEGEYSFTASTKLADRTFTDRGTFVVQALQLEELDLVANHAMLRRLANKTGGTFFGSDEVTQVSDFINDAGYAGTIRSESTKEPIINWYVILLVVAILLSTEWILRKYWGGY